VRPVRRPYSSAVVVVPNVTVRNVQVPNSKSLDLLRDNFMYLTKINVVNVLCSLVS